MEKIEAIDKKLLRYLTVRVKKFDIEANNVAKREDNDKKESEKNSLSQKEKEEIKKENKASIRR